MPGQVRNGPSAEEGPGDEAEYDEEDEFMVRCVCPTELLPSQAVEHKLWTWLPDNASLRILSTLQV